MLTDSMTAVATVTRSLPNARQSRPVIIMVATAPADTPSSARPNCPADAPTWALIAGMRTTHPANRKPSTAKNTVTATRSRRRAGSVVGVWWDRDSTVPILFSVGTK